MHMSGTFGFKVEIRENTDDGYDWGVYLSRQSERWIISQFATHLQAVETLTAFIREAREALDHLTYGEEYDACEG